jgi:hypothetical protein
MVPHHVEAREGDVRDWVSGNRRRCESLSGPGLWRESSQRRRSQRAFQKAEPSRATVQDVIGEVSNSKVWHTEASTEIGTRPIYLGFWPVLQKM